MGELRATCEMESARSVVLVDAENLFGDEPIRAHRRLKAFCAWVDATIEDPWVGRTYGNRRKVAQDWGEMEATLLRHHLTHVNNLIKEDEADRNLRADLRKVADLPLDVVLGSADYGSINDCQRELSGETARARIAWLVMTPHAQRKHSWPFAPGGKLSWFSPDRAITMDRIYRDFVANRPSGGEAATSPPARAHRGLALPDPAWWLSIRPVGGLGFTDRWARTTAAKIAEACGVGVLVADELTAMLAEWLPRAVPGHYHDDLSSLDDDAWAYQCLSALLAAALVPGRSGPAVYGVLLAFDRDLDELKLMAKLRAQALIRTQSTRNQGGLTQLIAR